MSETAAPAEAAEAAAQPEPTEAPVGKHWSDWVSLITAVLAVITAFASAEAGNLSSQVLLLQTQETDEWSFFQAKSLKAHVTQMEAEAIDLMEPAATAALAQKRAEAKQRYLEESTKYEAEKKAIDARARDLKLQRDLADRKGTEEGHAVIGLQIAIVLVSVAGITRRRRLLALGLACGLAGVGYLAAATWM